MFDGFEASTVDADKLHGSFASAAERYAEIIADAGLNAKVSREVLDVRSYRWLVRFPTVVPAEGFIAAVEICGSVLAAHFPPGALPRNELPDWLVEI